MNDAIDVSAYVINWFKSKPAMENDLTHMKMQKLLYYCQGHHLALFGTPLFLDEIEAWEHGPVVRSVYVRYSDIGRDVISKTLAGNSALVADRQKDFIREVLIVRGQFSAWRLRELTHEEAPWKDHYVEGQKEVIPVESMRDFFASFVKTN